MEVFTSITHKAGSVTRPHGAVVRDPWMPATFTDPEATQDLQRLEGPWGRLPLHRVHLRKIGLIYSFFEPLSSEDRESDQSDSSLPQKVTKKFYKAGLSTANCLLVSRPASISNTPGQ